MRGRDSVSRLLILGLALLLIVPLASTAVTADVDDIQLVISIDEPESGATWYDGGTALSISLAVRNSGSATQSIEYNPSCPVEIEMLSEDGAAFSSLREHRTCLEQRRAIDIPAGQTRNLDSFDWNWQDSNGETIGSGELRLNFDFETQTATYSETLQFQRSPVLIDNLVLQVSTAPPSDGSAEYGIGESVYSHLKMVNTGSESIQIDADEGCKVTIQATMLDNTYPISMTEIGCGIGATLDVGESLSLGWLEWDFTSEGVQLPLGQWSVAVATTGLSGLSSTIDATLVVSEPHAETLTDIAIGLLGDGGGDDIITDSDTLQISTQLVNAEITPAELAFNSTCLVNIHLISEDGQIVSDSRLDDVCESEYSEIKIDPGSQITLDQRVWSMNDANNCELNDGSYMLVVTIPEYGITNEYLFNYQGGDSGPACLASMQDTSLAQFQVIELRTNNQGTEQESITFQLRLDNQIDLDIHWPQECRLSLSLQRLGDSQLYRIWNEDCNQAGGILEILSAGSSMAFEPLTIEFANLSQGTWLVDVETTGTPRFSSQLAHTWNPPVASGISEEPSEEANNPDPEDTSEEVVAPLSWMAEGKWQYITTDVGGCWILIDVDGVEHAYSSTQVTGWKPLPNVRGAYWVEHTQESSLACAGWESQITVVEVLGEAEVAQTDTDSGSGIAAETPVIKIPAMAPTIVGIVASTSLLALLFGAITQVEWIRIPATKYGLALIGMVRKTKNSGGEYQRGRIVAYIELHRGIHFRALLGALEMSNGQLTHHLSVLESDERVWRRKDGRKVRYYPASIDSNTADEDLPVPVLTPDPNSLQGKILQILDIHENEILNLSQKELSIKLGNSQQLVSYHLKSLEDWGLVEKERVAMRYRYRLTDRALILLNTSDFPSLNDKA